MSKKREFRSCSFGFQGWMIEDMGLYGNELIIYSILNSVCQIPGMSYYGSKEYLGRFVGSTRTAIRILNQLVEKGYVEKRVVNGKKTEYIALVTDKNMVSRQDENNDDSTVTNCHTNCDKMSHLTVTNCHTNCDKMSHKYLKNINNNIYRTDRQEINGCLSERKKHIPTLEEVIAYAQLQHLKIDPVKFYEKNQERGWITKQGQPIKRWKSLMWSWNDNEDSGKAAEAKSKYSFQQNEYDFDQLEKDLLKN